LFENRSRWREIEKNLESWGKNGVTHGNIATKPDQDKKSPDFRFTHPGSSEITGVLEVALIAGIRSHKFVGKVVTVPPPLTPPGEGKSSKFLPLGGGGEVRGNGTK